ncbi:MAG: GIY-YIG nuclease family protein [Candidatus Falkowbacteria bacterium]
MNITLKDKVKNIPHEPGVYFWLDQNGEILYIGRATNLHQRTGQYLQKNISTRIAEMISLACDVKYQTTESLLEAIILEANLIKKHWPKYNVKDRDDRSFVYIVISKGDYPKPIIIRGQDLKKIPLKDAKVFGPYQSLTLAQAALRIIRRIFPYSTCVAHSGRACFDYQIGLCPGVCLGIINKKDYQKNINNIILLLGGKKEKLLANLIKNNPDKAKALQHIQDVTLLVEEKNVSEENIKRIEGYDISHLAGKETYGSMVVFSNNQPDKNEYRLFKIKDAPAGDDERALSEMLLRRLAHHEWPQPDLIMIDGGGPQIDFIQKLFNNHDVKIPFVGISKYAGDKLVFPDGTKKNSKDLMENIKPVLIKVREEAHRFVISAGRRARQIKK